MTLSTLAAHIDIPPRLLASLIVLGLVLIIWFFKAMLSGPEKGAVQRAGAPPCPTCGKLASWNATQNFWNCDRCNRPVPAPGTAPNPYGAAPNPYGQQPPSPYGQQPPNPYAQQPPPHAAQPQTPFCGTCGGPGRWIPESNAWGCDRCRQLIQPR